MEQLLQDLGAAWRQWRTAPRLVVAALACIALGIGATVFILTVAHGILLARPPFPDADRLVRLWISPEGTQQRQDLSVVDARDVQAAARSFDALEIAARTRIAITTSEGTERLRGESVTAGYFDLIALRPALGRLFNIAEYDPGAAGVMLISDRLWRQKFASRPDVVGQTVRARDNAALDGDRVYTIVGVLPANFVGTVDSDISDFWLPIEQYTPRRVLEARQVRNAWVMARLRPGVTLPQAQAEVAAITRRLAAEYPEEYRQLNVRAEPLGESWRVRYRSALLMLTGAAALLLLIACTNVAHFVLARVSQRETELRLRHVLGAQRGRLLRLLFLENLVLAATGGLAGTLLAAAAVRLFTTAGVFQLPPYVQLSLDGRVIVLAFGLVLCTALAFGLLPVALGLRFDDASGLRAGSRGNSMGRRQRRITDALVAAQIAFSFLLLIGSALMLRTYGNLLRADLGFRTDHIVRLAISLDRREYADAAARIAFARAADTHLRTQPGVRDVTVMAGVLPPWFDFEVSLSLDGTPLPALRALPSHAIDTTFFPLFQIPLRHGRHFQSMDHADAPRVAIVSETLARTIAQGDARAAVGQSIFMTEIAGPPSAAQRLEVVGVVADVRYNGPLGTRTSDNDLYLPIEQYPSAQLSIAIVTESDPAIMVAPLQRALAQLAPSSPLHWISTMDEELRLQYADARLYAWLTGLFGGCALLLALLGIYGVVTHAVGRRFTELGVRMAVGAQRLDILRLVITQGSRPVLAGLLVGAAAALATVRLLRSLVYGLTPADPVTFGGVALLLLSIAVLACYLPARRATRLDPRAVLQR